MLGFRSADHHARRRVHAGTRLQQRPRPGAWEIETLDDLEGLASELSVRGALVGASDHGSTKALYASARL